MSATPLSTKKPLSHLKHVCLSEWWLVKPQLQHQGLAVGGIAYGERAKVFLSAVIAKRYEANVLETEDGISVQFRGMINSARTSENGFPSKVCEDFLLGFPDDWKKYTDHSFADESVEGVTGFGDSNARSSKSAVDGTTSCKSMVGSPISTKKTRKEKVIASSIGQVRRSPRLHNCRK